MPLTGPSTGEVHWPGHAVGQLGDVFDHPHVVLIPAGQRRSTLVKGTTSPADVSRCPHLCHSIAPTAANGLRKPGWMMGVALERTAGLHLRRPAGTLSATELSAVRRVVALALGAGSGVGLHPGEATRGRIVRLALPMAKPEIEWAVILTELTYSALGAYQVIVPLLDATARTPSHASVFVPSNVVQSATVGALYQAFAAVELVQSVWHPKHVAELTTVTVPEADVDAIAQAAMTFLGVP